MMDAEALLARCSQGLTLAEQLLEVARGQVARLVSRNGKPDAGLLETHQMATHGLSWMATYVEALRQTLLWARTLPALGAVESAILQLGFAEYLQQLAGGIPISQTEMIRPSDMGVPADAVQALQAHTFDPAEIAAARVLLASAAAEGNYGAVGLADETIDAIRSQFLRYAAEEVAPHAQGWHQRDELIPMQVVQQLGEMGVFGLTVGEEHGGAGLGKIAMCVVSEALSGGYIGVGSLGTRAEIAAELIGLELARPAQKEKYLPAIGVRHDPADRGVHRAEHRLRPRQPAHTCRARRRSCTSGHRRVKPGSRMARGPI